MDGQRLFMTLTLLAKCVDLRESTKSTGVGELNSETDRRLLMDVLDKYSPDKLKITTNVKTL
jgi:hypothetical protein